MQPFMKANQPFPPCPRGQIRYAETAPRVLQCEAFSWKEEPDTGTQRFFWRKAVMQNQLDYEVVVEATTREVVTSSADFVLAIALFRAAIPQYRHRVIELRQGKNVIRTYIPP
jgi:hypothetical protein